MFGSCHSENIPLSLLLHKRQESLTRENIRVVASTEAQSKFTHNTGFVLTEITTNEAAKKKKIQQLKTETTLATIALFYVHYISLMVY